MTKKVRWNGNCVQYHFEQIPQTQPLTAQTNETRSSCSQGLSLSRTPREYDREVVCLPQNEQQIGHNVFYIPRSGRRRLLTDRGLVGTVHLTSLDTTEEIKEAISSLFRQAFGLEHHDEFRFEFLRWVRWSHACIFLKPKLALCEVDCFCLLIK